MTASLSVSVSSSSPLPAVEPLRGMREHVVFFIAWAVGFPLSIFFHLIRWPELS